MANQTYVSMFKDGGGGRVEYVLHIGGYPWAVCTHPDVVAALSDPASDADADYARSEMFGSLSWTVGGSGTKYPRRDVQVYPLLDFTSLGKQEYRSEVSKGILTGGSWSCDVFDDDIVFSPNYVTVSGDSYRGLDGLHRVSVPNGATPTVGYAKLTSPVKRYTPTGSNITTLSFADVSNGILISTAARTADSFDYMPVWLNHECIGIYSTAGSSVIDVDAAICGVGAARGLFKSRRQDHFTSGLYGKNPFVSSSPGSIAGKFAWLYAIPFDDDGNMLEDDSGNPIVITERCGIVAPDVRTQNGRTKINVNPPLDAGKASTQPYKKTKSSSHFAGYTFSRGNSGTSTDSILKWRQKPHLLMYERNATTKTFTDIRPIWICARNSSVHFDTIDEVREALRKELQLVANGSSSQLSGDGSDSDNTPVQTTEDWSENNPFTTGTGVRWRPIVDGCLPWVLGGQMLTPPSVHSEFPGRILNLMGTQIFELIGDAFSGPSTYAFQWLPIDPSLNPNSGSALMPPATYYHSWAWDTDLQGPWSLASGEVHPKPINVDYFIPANDKYYVQPTPDGVLTVGETYSFGKTGTTQPIMSAEISTVTTDSNSNVIEFDVDGGNFEIADGSQSWVYGQSLYDNAAVSMWDQIQDMSDEEKKQAINNYDFANLDRCRLSTIEAITAVVNPAALLRLLMGDRTVDVTVSGTNQNTWCPFFVTEGDFTSMIDWDVMDQVFQKISTGQYYILPQSDDETLTFYDILKTETLYHRCRMTYEFDASDGMWKYKFSEIGPANRSQALVSGMTIDDNVIVDGVVTETHSVDQKYDSLTVFVNRTQDNKFQGQVSIEGVNVAGVLPNTRLLKIKPYISRINAGLDYFASQALAGGSQMSNDIYNGFSGAFMTALSSPTITQRMKLTCAARFSAPIGKSIIFSASGARTPYTHEYGLSNEPGFVTRYSYDIARSTCQIDFEVGGEFINTIAPSCKLSAGEFTFDSTTVSAVPDDHEFTDDDDMKDVFYFDCYSPGNDSSAPTLRDCDCDDYAVVILKDDDSWTPLTGTCSVSVAGTLTITVASTATMSLTDDYYVIFNNHGSVEDCQKYWIYKCDDNNQVGSTNDHPTFWI